MGDQDERRQRPWRHFWTKIAGSAPSISDLGALFLLDPTGVLSYDFVELSAGDELEQLWSDIADYLAAR
jgi:hypothetical protein